MARSIKISEALWERVRQCAERGGYASPVEFVEHAIEKELARLEAAASEEEVAKQLRGLGYLD